MTETRKFTTAALASISSGILFCEFSEMHEVAEYLMGHPIWTHHFADKKLAEAMSDAVMAQCPGMPGPDSQITKENYHKKLAGLVARLGPTQTIRKGGGQTAMAPTDGIPDHVSVIVSVTVEESKP